MAMRCGAVYHVLFSAGCVMTQAWLARPLPYRRCTTPQSVSQTDSTKGQAGTLHSQVHSCRHQGRSTWLRALWLKIRKHSVSHTRLLRRKGEPITEFQNTASAPQCDTEITVPTMVNVSGETVSFQCKDILSMPSEAEVCCSSVYLQAVMSKAEF